MGGEQGERERRGTVRREEGSRFYLSRGPTLSLSHSLCESLNLSAFDAANGEQTNQKPGFEPLMLRR